MKFTAQEKQLFLPIVRQCLENRPDKRPSSVMLVQELRHIKSSLPRGSHVATPIEHLRQQFSAKEEECRQKDEAMKEKDAALKENVIVTRVMQADIQQLRSQNSVLHQQLAAKEAEVRQSEEVVREKSPTIQAQQAEIQRLRDQPAVSLKVS